MTPAALLIAALILLAALTILLFALAWFLSVLGGVQYVSTPHTVFPLVLELANLSPGDRFVELGSGNGALCCSIATHTGARVLGIDINPLLVAYARWQARHNPDITFTWSNLYRADLRSVAVVYCYLLPDMLASLAPRFREQLPRGARVISYAFPLPDREPNHVIPRSSELGALYVYEY